jgi:hypothetical protein
MVQLPLGWQARSLRSGPVAWRVPGASGVAMPALSAASPALRTVGETGRNSLAAVPTLRVVPSARTVELPPGSWRLARPLALCVVGPLTWRRLAGGPASCGRGHRPAPAWLATAGPPARGPCRRAADVAALAGGPTPCGRARPHRPSRGRPFGRVPTRTVQLPLGSRGNGTPARGPGCRAAREAPGRGVARRPADAWIVQPPPGSRRQAAPARVPHLRGPLKRQALAGRPAPCGAVRSHRPPRGPPPARRPARSSP